MVRPEMSFVLKRVLALCMCAALLLSTGCQQIAAYLPLAEGVIQPSITPRPESPPMPPVAIEWRFEGTDLRIEVPVDSAVYHGAREAEKSAIFLNRDKQQTEWVSGYFRAFIGDPLQEPLYDNLLSSLRSLRDSLGLDDDRYVELIISLAQSLEYRTDPVNLEPKFPIETIVDRAGDCDDKSLLAAALLAREGYDVALLLFTPERHLALGIRGNGETHKNSGYMYVEMTAPSIIGFVPEQLEGGQALTSEPEVIRIGEGTRQYGAGYQVDAIRKTFEAAQGQAEGLGAQLESSEARLREGEREINSLSRRMEEFAAEGNIAGFNELVPRYNRMAEEHNAAVQSHNELVDRQLGYIETAERIREGQSDRHGLSRWLGL